LERVDRVARGKSRYVKIRALERNRFIEEVTALSRRRLFDPIQELSRFADAIEARERERAVVQPVGRERGARQVGRGENRECRGKIAGLDEPHGARKFFGWRFASARAGARKGFRDVPEIGGTRGNSWMNGRRETDGPHGARRHRRVEVLRLLRARSAAGDYA